MRKMSVITEDVQQAIFSNLPAIIAFHQTLNSRLTDSWESEQGVGIPFYDEATGFLIYGQYCANLHYAKHVLDQQKKSNPRFVAFLEVGRDMAQCRRMDLWDLLDYPRRRLQRYPLLIKTVIHHTELATTEHVSLSNAMVLLEQTTVRKYSFKYSLQFSYHRS
jgi:RhoGEF domain